MTLPSTLPSAAALLDGAHAYSIPLRRSFRGIERREGLLVRGPSGWGEFAPFDDYSPAADARWLAAAIEAAWGTWPAPVRDTVPVNAIVPAVSPDDARQLVRESGCATVKVKVAQAGEGLADDVARVSAVRDELGSIGHIRVDANGAWSVTEAITALSELAVFDLEYAEQPCRTLNEMRALRPRVEVPLAVDEGVRRADVPEHVAGLREAGDVLVLKAAPLGGVTSSLAVASSYDMRCVVSSALETSIGLGAGLALAAALPELELACGLGTARLLAADVVTRPLVAADGRLTVTRPVVDDDAFETVGAPEQLDRWRKRVEAAHEALLARTRSHPHSLAASTGGPS
jgi:O-succinylbenzoate synthase